MLLLTKLVVFSAFISSAFGLGFINVYGSIKQVPYTGDPGVPLILTPLIKAGRIKEAQEAASVSSDIFQGVESYSGYLTVDEHHNSNLFFWFFPARTNYKTAPVVLWLQGGPGATSMIGLFAENGPFFVKPNLGVALRKFAWTENHSVIYIDNPVGTGYSFTDHSGYCQNETAVGAHMYIALLQFFQLFPDLQQNDFFVTGESYAGKYVPAVSYAIHRNNPLAKQKINLKGLAIGNGLSDPEHQLKYSEYLYQIGLIDTNAREKFAEIEEEGVELIRMGKYLKAFEHFDNLINGDFNNQTSYFKNVTGFDNYFNFLVVKNTGIDYYGTFLQQTTIRKAIHVGNAIFNGENQEVEKNLVEDVMRSVASWISELLSHYRVLVYNGQLDIIVAYPLTVNYLKNLDFSAAEEYKTVERRIWYVDGELAGYVKQAGNLTEILVRNAGHMVPTDQPRWALDLITRFTYNKRF